MWRLRSERAPVEAVDALGAHHFAQRVRGAGIGKRRPRAARRDVLRVGSASTSVLCGCTCGASCSHRHAPSRGKRARVTHRQSHRGLHLKPRLDGVQRVREEASQQAWRDVAPRRQHERCQSGPDGNISRACGAAHAPEHAPLRSTVRVEPCGGVPRGAGPVGVVRRCSVKRALQERTLAHVHRSAACSRTRAISGTLVFHDAAAGTAAARGTRDGGANVLVALFCCTGIPANSLHKIACASRRCAWCHRNGATASGGTLRLRRPRRDASVVKLIPNLTAAVPLPSSLTHGALRAQAPPPQGQRSPPRPQHRLPLGTAAVPSEWR